MITKKKLKKINTNDPDLTTIQANVEEILKNYQLQINLLLEEIAELKQRVFDLESP